MSLPYCIPVTWPTPEAYCLAYHHSPADARLYGVVLISRVGPPSAFDAYHATVDDFGDLVPVKASTAYRAGV